MSTQRETKWTPMLHIVELKRDYEREETRTENLSLHCGDDKAGKI